MSVDLKQNRILELTGNFYEGANTFEVTAASFRREGFAGTTYPIAMVQGAAAAAATGHVLTLGETIPNFTHIKFIISPQA